MNQERKYNPVNRFPVVRKTGASYYQTYKNSGRPLSRTPENLGKYYGPIENQGSEGSCTAFAGLLWRGALRRQAGLPWINPSFQAQYYKEREREGTVNTDAGAFMEDIIIVLEQFGVLPAEKDPYLPTDITTPPPTDGWNTDLKLSPDRVCAVNQATILQDTLDALSEGHPVLFGFEVFAIGWEDVSYNGTGILAMPGINEVMIGGHAVNAVYYDVDKKLILVRNQYGPQWGIRTPADEIGDFWMPFDYYAKYAYNAYVGLPDSMQPQPKKLYRVQIGRFPIADKADADALCKELVAKGFGGYVTKVGDEYRVQTAAYANDQAVFVKADTLLKAGYTEVILTVY